MLLTLRIIAENNAFTSEIIIVIWVLQQRETVNQNLVQFHSLIHQLVLKFQRLNNFSHHINLKWEHSKSPHTIIKCGPNGNRISSNIRSISRLNSKSEVSIINEWGKCSPIIQSHRILILVVTLTGSEWKRCDLDLKRLVIDLIRNSWTHQTPLTSIRWENYTLNCQLDIKSHWWIGVLECSL